MDDTLSLEGVAPARRAGVRPPCATARRKRVLDVAASGTGLLLLAVPCALTALLIRLDSRGPVLFRQTRIGRSGRPFTMYKFRTMSDGNSSEAHRDYVRRMIREDDGTLRNRDGAHKLEDDPRVTRVGRWLRKTSLDELPQLLNVFLGDMSLVGPRPPLPYEVEVYSPRHRRRLEAVPGITGLWQVSGRNQTTFEEMVDLDVTYIEGWSLLLDLRILARTVPECARREGGLSVDDMTWSSVSSDMEYWGPNLLRNYTPVRGSGELGRRPGSRPACEGKARYPTVHLTQDMQRRPRDPEVDAVLIATPICTHYDLAMRALRAGKHVFVEKPTGASVA